MNIHGSRAIDAPRQAVFEAICDPAVLFSVIPGCQNLARTSGTEYRGEIALRLPGIVGTYQTVVRLVDTSPPTYGRLEGEVVGALGSIRGHATFHLGDAGEQTIVEYHGMASIGGPLARLDSRFIEGIAGSLIGQGLERLNTRLRTEAADDGTRPARNPTQETPA